MVPPPKRRGRGKRGARGGSSASTRGGAGGRKRRSDDRSGVEEEIEIEEHAEQQVETELEPEPEPDKGQEETERDQPGDDEEEEAKQVVVEECGGTESSPKTRTRRSTRGRPSRGRSDEEAPSVRTEVREETSGGVENVDDQKDQKDQEDDDADDAEKEKRRMAETEVEMGGGKRSREEEVESDSVQAPGGDTEGAPVEKRTKTESDGIVSSPKSSTVTRVNKSGGIQKASSLLRAGSSWFTAPVGAKVPESGIQSFSSSSSSTFSSSLIGSSGGTVDIGSPGYVDPEALRMMQLAQQQRQEQELSSLVAEKEKKRRIREQTERMKTGTIYVTDAKDVEERKRMTAIRVKRAEEDAWVSGTYLQVRMNNAKRLQKIASQRQVAAQHQQQQQQQMARQAPLQAPVPQAPLPVGWTMLIDAASQRPYYYHSFTKKTSWERPSDTL